MKFNHKFNLIFPKFNLYNFKTFDRYLHTYLFKMDKVYLRNLPETKQFQITMQLINPRSKIPRQFNFCRQLSETVGVFLTRIQTNVEKSFNKRIKKKQLENLPEANNSLNVALFLNNEKINDDIMCKDIFIDKNKVSLKIMDNIFEVIINSPYVDALAMPKCMMATFPTYPAEFKYVNVDKKLCEFNWHKSMNKETWEICGTGFTYCPDNADIDHYLKLSCTPKDKNKEGPIAEAISDVTVTASPGLCPFENRHVYTKEKCATDEFRVVSYNILADLYCDSDYTRTTLHPYCPPYALVIDYRQQLFLKEILGYNADIICLQEVDRRRFNYDLDPVLSTYNYGSYYTQKGGTVAEGVACFYNNEKFKLIEGVGYILSEELSTNSIFVDIWNCIELNSELKERLVERMSALQIVALENISNGNIVLIANTHLYFAPDADHIRLLQAGICIKYIEDFYKKILNRQENKRVSIIFCGDFNSTPECGIYKLFTTGFVPDDCIDWSSNKEEEVKDFSLTQPFNLDSACGTPKYTNFTAEFADCLDYIFFDKNNLEVTKVVPLPTDKELLAHVALPSIVAPSDHIALIADLKWTK